MNIGISFLPPPTLPPHFHAKSKDDSLFDGDPWRPSDGGYILSIHI